MAEADDVLQAVGIGSVAFGVVAALTPRLFLGLYGVPDEPGVRTMTRLWGTRTAVLGALALSLQGAQDKQRVVSMTTAMNIADAALVATAGGISGRSRVLGSLTSAVFAGALAYVSKR